MRVNCWCLCVEASEGCGCREWRRRIRVVRQGVFLGCIAIGSGTALSLVLDVYSGYPNYSPFGFMELFSLFSFEVDEGHAFRSTKYHFGYARENTCKDPSFGSVLDPYWHVECEEEWIKHTVLVRPVEWVVPDE